MRRAEYIGKFARNRTAHPRGVEFTNPGVLTPIRNNVIDWTAVTKSLDFTNDLFQPVYPIARFGDWEFRNIITGGDRGFWGDLYGMRPMTILVGPSVEGQSSWMSTAAVELESQEIGIHAAHGSVVVLGLGMGWAAINMALRDEVDRVTVVDINTDVINLIQQSGILDQLSAHAREKLTIIHDDALTWRPDHAVDTLLADIWLKLVEPDKFDQARRMQENIQAKQVYVWGQEPEIWKLCQARQGSDRPPDRSLIDAVVEADIRLPLILPDWDDFGERLVEMGQWWCQGQS
jgi:hypothetical protein